MQQLSVWLAFSFGAVFICALLALAVAIPSPTDQQFEIFRIVIAIAAAGVAAVIPGVLNVGLRQGRGLVITAGGALAVFVITYFYSPARWATQATSNNHVVSQPEGSRPNVSAPGGNAIGGDNNGNATVNNKY
jgi:hypothetical protein